LTVASSNIISDKVTSVTVLQVTNQSLVVSLKKCNSLTTVYKKKKCKSITVWIYFLILLNINWTRCCYFISPHSDLSMYVRCVLYKFGMKLIVYDKLRSSCVIHSLITTTVTIYIAYFIV